MCILGYTVINVKLLNVTVLPADLFKAKYVHNQ